MSYFRVYNTISLLIFFISFLILLFMYTQPRGVLFLPFNNNYNMCIPNRSFSYPFIRNKESWIGNNIIQHLLIQNTTIWTFLPERNIPIVNTWTL